MEELTTTPQWLHLTCLALTAVISLCTKPFWLPPVLDFFLGGECSKLTSPNPVYQICCLVWEALGALGQVQVSWQTSQNAQILQESAETIILVATLRMMV